MTHVFTQSENRQWAHSLPGKMSSACIALCARGRVLMVKAKYKDHWTFPSGIVDPGESPKAAVIRETDEEVGVHVEDIDCRFLTVIYTAAHGGDRDRFNFVFVVDTFDDSMSLSVPNEEIELAQWVDFSEVAQRAGKRRSYVAIQRMLLEPDEMKPYVEV